MNTDHETDTGVMISSVIGTILNIVLITVFIAYKNALYLQLFTIVYAVIVLFIFTMLIIHTSTSISNIFTMFFFCLFVGTGLILVYGTVFITTSEYYLKSKHRGYFIPTKDKEEEHMSRILSGKIEPFRMQEDE